MAAVSPFALSLLGIDSLSRRRRVPDAPEEVPEEIQNMPEMRAARTSRRATSHYNAFQTVCSSATDSPPPYVVATRQKLPQRLQPNRDRDVLPGYTCTVATEAKLLLAVESMNPLHAVSDPEWREVYMTLRGTLLSFYRTKDGGPGRLLRQYTLQHAEVGLAADSQHTVLIPQTRLAHLIPSATRHKAWQKDPSLFKAVRQNILRLRVESDQILLADASEARVHDIVSALSASIDISTAIDERSAPRQCTIPRRRRRQRPRLDGDLTDPVLLAEQERILHEMYPAFAERITTQTPQLGQTTTQNAQPAPVQTNAREEDDLDLTMLREELAAPTSASPSQSDDGAQRPAVSRQTTASSVTSTFSADMLYATSPNNFNAAGKWQPRHLRTEAQIQRYTRRCMPVLLAKSVRASDILICQGKRVKVNWRMELLEEWELKPPSYKSHNFATESGLERTKSQSSQSPSANSAPHQSSSQFGASVDHIEAIESGLANVELAKVTTKVDKAVDFASSPPRAQSETKGREARHPGAEVHGVVFCF